MAMPAPTPFLLTPIDNVMPRHLLPKLLFFPESSGQDVLTAANALRDGLSKTLKAITVLSGTVQAIGQKGELCVTAPWNTVDDIFLVNDLRNKEGLSYQDLRDKNFPMEDLDKRILMPVARIRGVGNPVLIVQANIIRGGIITSLLLHHNFTDENGTAAIAEVWAAYCRGEDGSRLVTREMIDRGRLMQRGWESASLADVPEYSLMPDQQAPSGSLVSCIYTFFRDWLTLRLRGWTMGTKKLEGEKFPEPTKIDSAIFFFPKDRLVELKSLAKNHSEDDSAWVSTSDALCALLGCCIHCARGEEIRSMANRRCRIALVVQGRRMLDPPLPSEYIGNVTNFASITVPSESVLSTPASVAEIAHLIRHQIKRIDEPYIRKAIAALSSVKDLSRVIPTPPSPSEDTIGVSSWARQRYYDMDWGKTVGTRIERVRFGAGKQNLIIIMPELNCPNECGVEVEIGLERGQMERLKQNELFMRFSQWRCN